MPTIDKVIVSNRAALTAKYGAAGVTAINAALRRLIAADLARGHRTQVVEIDNAAQMAAFGGAAVIGPTDQRGAKQAVDAICASAVPDYVMLLDGPDVVPHIALNRIRGITDGDPTIDSDLPYASAASFSLNASAYLAVTRVVGRLPTPVGTSNASTLVSLIDLSANHVQRPAQDYVDFFSISASVWQVSTQLSLSSLFGSNTGLHLAPLDTHNGIDPALQRLPHFINCHGARSDWRFYGQAGAAFPVAMESALTQPNISPGAVAAVECCYGAELYNHTLSGWPQPICMSYLLRGAVAFMGSTNIAYGPAASVGQADLMCQFFLEDVLKGASTGRAMLQARQRFVATQTMSTATNLKTLAQFVLYGDPSLLATPAPSSPHMVAVDGTGLDAIAKGGVATDVTPDVATTAKDRESSRKARRVALASDGMAFAAAATFPGSRAKAPEATEQRIRDVAKANGFSIDPKIFAVSGGANFKAASKNFGRVQKVAVAVERAKEPAMTDTGVELPSYRVFVAHILGDGLTKVEVSESR